jgi:hypothetical protein
VVGGETMDKITITNNNGESITLGNQSPYFLQILEGASELPVTIESQKAPKQDGSTYFDNTLENRAITLEGMIVTKNNPSLVKEARRRMQRVLNPKLGEVTIAYQGKEIKGIVEKAISKAILSQLGIKYVEAQPRPPSTSGQVLYRVMTGSYAVRENAERQVERLKAAGFDATIMIFKP